MRSFVPMEKKAEFLARQSDVIAAAAVYLIAAVKTRAVAAVSTIMPMGTSSR